MHLSDLPADVVILGAGITGITCGITMQELGFRVAIIAENIPTQETLQQRNPLLATAYAMASAYPHNLRVQNLNQISDDSQEIFKHLFQKQQIEHRLETGIKKYRIFEVYEEEPNTSASPLSERRMNFQTFDGNPEKLRSTLDPPYRSGVQQIWGWVFDSYFADMPVYLKFLWDYFKSRGGIFCQKKLDSIDEVNEIFKQNNRIVVNCLGLGAVKLFKDKTEARILRGRQILAPNLPMIVDKAQLPLAYNYTPEPSIFKRPDGSAEYVHFFSRSDSWILGQTREAGKLDQNDCWIGEVEAKQERVIDGLSIPSPMITLNQDILTNWKGLSFAENSLVAREGYRYYRDPDNSGVRLEQEKFGNSILLHNYGHGGSGISMSWGCAIACARLISGMAANTQASPDKIFDSSILNCVSRTATQNH